MKSLCLPFKMIRNKICSILRTTYKHNASISINIYTWLLSKQEHSQYSIYRIDHQHIKTKRVMKNWVKWLSYFLFVFFSIFNSRKCGVIDLAPSIKSGMSKITTLGQLLFFTKLLRCGGNNFILQLVNFCATWAGTSQFMITLRIFKDLW